MQAIKLSKCKLGKRFKKMKKVIIHCSDSRWGNAAEITKWHMGRGFSTIGYHYVILNSWITGIYQDIMFDGHIETARNPEINGAHTRGHNEAIGICLIGKPGLYTNAQYGALHKLLNHLKYLHGSIKIYQHSDFDEKKSYCASIDLTGFKKIEEE